jgi:hypothetical protein
VEAANPFFEQPVLNGPYDEPSRHWELDPAGQPTQRILPSRRRAEFITPIRFSATTDIGTKGVCTWKLGAEFFVSFLAFECLRAFTSTPSEGFPECMSASSGAFEHRSSRLGFPRKWRAKTTRPLPQAALSLIQAIRAAWNGVK